MLQLFAGILIVLLHAMLVVYFFYTLLAIVSGAAPCPSRFKTVQRMMRIADLRPGDRFIDLGSGDGRLLFVAAKTGAICRGIEINPLLCLYSRVVARLKGYPGISIERRNLWTTDLFEADIVTVYFVPYFMNKLRTKIWAEMRPGARVISAVYRFPDWEPDQIDGNVFLYTVPHRNTCAVPSISLSSNQMVRLSVNCS